MKSMSFLFEEDWASEADADEGEMHRVLNISKDKKIEDEYDSGKKLADDLVDAVGSEKEAAGMINYAANLGSGQIFKDAQDRIKEKDYEE